MMAADICTPDLSDDNPACVRACELQFTGYGKKTAFGGVIETIKCFEDNSLVKSTLAENGDGKVLVVDGGGSLRRALLGDQIAASAVRNGWAGLVFFGVVRDVDILNTLDIGVKALGSIPLKTEKRGEGQKGLLISFGGVDFEPGSYVYADNNGVIVSSECLI